MGKDKNLYLEEIIEDIKDNNIFSKKLSEMLNRYNIKEMFVKKVGDKDITRIIEKRIRNTQIQTALKGHYGKIIQEKLRELREEQQTGD